MRILLTSFSVTFFIYLHAQPILELPVYQSGFKEPVDIANAGDERLFIVEKAGRIRIINGDGTVAPQPFLNIGDRVRSQGGEQGLLGLVFHPDYAANGFFFVNYTDNDGDTRIARFQVTAADPDQADPDSEKILLAVDQPFANHNAGDLSFGPDGYLYIGLGDGGSGGDPQDNGQDRQSLLGKMLRIDVDNGDPYAIPPDNPFAETDETLDEIWALGLRNPWRFSFDRLTGDMWIADVGQNKFEEIDFQPASSTGGENYGWRCYEGNQSFNLTGDCPDASELTFPVHEYPHGSQNCRSVTGGFVYRGMDFPGLQGYYIYGEYCTGEIWGLIPEVEGGFVNVPLRDFRTREIVSFGEDQNGELYLAGINTGNIYRVTDACASLAAPEITFDDDVLSVPDTFAAYQWFVDGEMVDGATAAEFLPAATGAVTVEVTDARGCTAMSEAFIISAVAEAMGIRRWLATPNPFRSQLNLEVELTEPASFQLKIYDTSGRLVFQDRLDRAMHWTRQYQLKELESGLYFLTLERGQQKVIQKILKTD